MASAGKTAANIEIIKSDLHAIIACVTVKRGHQEAGGLYDRGSILPERGYNRFQMENRLVETIYRKTGGGEIRQTCRKPHNKENVSTCGGPTDGTRVREKTVHANLPPQQRQGATQARRSVSSPHQPGSSLF